MAALFISASDFDSGTLFYIPNQNESLHFAQFLETKEREILDRLFGFEFSNALFDQFEASGTPAQKWLDLRDGEDGFEYSGEVYNWKGLVDLLAPAIYAEWMRYSYDKLTNIGVGINQKTDFNMVGPDQKIAYNHNEFVRRSWILYAWLEYRQADFELWEGFYKRPKLTNSLGI